MEEAPARRKRSRVSESADGDDKRRGRPRVDKQDESAADRRRTQIRMAQRAYRQRKESTLDELRKRVSDLSNTVEVMNKLFGECKDRLYASNLAEVQMFDLHDTATEFETLVKDARHHPSDDSGDEAPRQARKPSNAASITDTPAQAPIEPKNVPSWMDQSVVAPSFPKVRSSMDIGLGYSLFEPENDVSTQAVTMAGFQPDTINLGSFENSTMPTNIDISDMFHADSAETMAIPASLSPPTTYSFQETSLARRIHRACAEAAYQLILDPRRRPAEFERIFRLTLLGRTREKIAASLKDVLDRGPHEDLDLWAAPLIHIGGAGTHYPRRDPYGNVVPRKTSHHIGIVGPQTLALLDNAIQDNISIDMTVQLAGFEGEWFDSYDVQGYLEEKGIFIDPMSSFAEAEIIEWSPTSASGSATSSHNRTPPPVGLPSPGRSTPLTGTQIEKMINEADADLGQWNEYSNMQLTAVGFSDAASGSWMNFMQPGEGINSIQAQLPQQTQPNIWEINPTFVQNVHPPSPQPKRKNVIIDVSKFVKVMTFSGVCLGRTPGFRRRDVDRALAISSFDAF